MEVIQPTSKDKRLTLEQMRDVLFQTWGEEEYYQSLESQVKRNHSDILKFVERYPTYTSGYSAISELYKLEETIMIIRCILNNETDDKFINTRLTKDLEV